jgi:hypothetical protein
VRDSAANRLLQSYSKHKSLRIAAALPTSTHLHSLLMPIPPNSPASVGKRSYLSVLSNAATSPASAAATAPAITITSAATNDGSPANVIKMDCAICAHSCASLLVDRQPCCLMCGHIYCRACLTELERAERLKPPVKVAGKVRSVRCRITSRSSSAPFSTETNRVFLIVCFLSPLPFCLSPHITAVRSVAVRLLWPT